MMRDQSEREKLIERLKKDKSIRAELPDGFIESVETDPNIADKDDYILLSEQWKYLRQGRINARNAKDEEKIEYYSRQMEIVRRYLLVAEFGDPNIGRFTL